MSDDNGTHYVYEDDAQAVDLLNRHLNGQALRPPRSATPYKMMSARLSEEALTGLRNIAARLGYVRAGHGNVSLLLEAIGTGTVEVTPTLLQARRL